MKREIPKIGVGRASKFQARAAIRNHELTSFASNGEHKQEKREARRMARTRLRLLIQLSRQIEGLILLVEESQRSIHDRIEQDEKRQVEVPIRIL